MAPSGSWPMKKFLKTAGKALLILILVPLVLVSLFVLIGNLTQISTPLTTVTGQSAQLNEALAESWKNTPSHIEGMTKWDLYSAGLSLVPGADTDGDGLTDQEEIERYNTDPLKVSSSGDLYSDLYKIQHDMDVSRAYEYTESAQFVHNSCPEVVLTPKIPTDFNAVVTQIPMKEWSGMKVYAAYSVYNYSGNFSVDLSQVLQREGLTLSDISVYVSDGNKTGAYSFSKSGNTLTLRKAFSPKSSYTVYCTEKNFGAFAASALNSMLPSGTFEGWMPEEEEITGAGLVFVSPLLTELGNYPITIYYERLSTEENSLALRDKIMAYTEEYFSLKGQYPYDFQEKSAIEIEILYSSLSSILSFLDTTGMSGNDISWQHLLFLYFSYEDMLAQGIPGSDASGETGRPQSPNADPVSGFDPFLDTLPFGNFKTTQSPNGSCAGISHLTAYLYNQGYYPNRSNGEGSWDLTLDPENATLCDPGLGDYKTESFVRDHSQDGQTLSEGLSQGEEAFLNMIASAYQTGNANAEFICYEVFGGDFQTVVQDYAVIEAAKTYLESGKILDVYLDMVDGTRHTVNIYSYRTDPQNPDVVWFSVYDCNFPGNQTGGQPLSDTGFALRVEKKLRLDGNGWTFSYDYFPLEDQSYGATSNPNRTKTSLILILDEFGHLLND